MIITTTPSIEGAHIIAYHGVVFGEVIMATNMGQDFVAGFNNFFGGRSETYEQSLAEARDNAIEEMKKRALALGANAIVGMDVDYESHAQMLMVTASGTAVTTE